MDLGISGRTAIICASSKGLGRGCAQALAEAGCTVVINGRDAATLEATASQIRASTGATVLTVVADVSTRAGQDALLAAAPEPDILINNNGGPPPKPFRDVSREALLEGVVQNMATPLELIQRVVDGMIARRFGRIVNITSASVLTPLTGLDVSSAARAGLTAFLAGVAREVAHANVTINNVLPGSFDTDRLKSGLTKMAAIKGMSVEEMAKARRSDVPAGRFGEADEFGKLCAFLASSHAGYITGQNVLIDGGAFRGSF
ncbi:MAG: 3-oxoacyl-ACP reductase [Hyphomicrobiales bacterium]|nr:MAG: 3-oxoacyl-ACP reductase [Hyphomicrobiales bacterium]